MNRKNPSRKKRWLWIGSTIVGAVALCTAALARLTADLPIPPPTGPHPVGFAETVVVQGERPISLDVWYPAHSTTGHAAEPYTTATLNRELARSLKLPPVLGTVTPSHSFRDAPILEGKHPVVVFNHGFGSFTRQNFSNFQELASHGYLVLSIGHPGDSLMARTLSGEPVLLDTHSKAYLAVMAQQKDLGTFLKNNAAGLKQQREASTPEQHLAASQAMSRIAPFQQLKEQIQTWVQDTRLVIRHLQDPTSDLLKHADGQQVVLMGHSLGGVVANHFAQHPVPGVQGVINLDAPFVQFSDDPIDPSTLRVPMLHFLSTQYTIKGHNVAVAGSLDPLLKHSKAPAYVIEVPGTAHYNFSDMNYVQALRFTPMLGSVPGLVMEKHLNVGILNFLQTLRNPERMGTPLLQDQKVRQVFYGARP